MGTIDRHRPSCSAVAIGAALFALAGVPAARAEAERIVPPGWETTYENFHYAPAVRAGDTLYLSGVVANLSEDPAQRDMDAAFDGAFRAIASILAEAGASWADVVEMTSFHTDLPEQIVTFSAVKDRWVQAPYPAWTAIDIDRLYPDDGIAEIRVTAWLGEQD